MAGIALVHWAFSPTVGGVETHLWEFSQRLAGRGYDVVALTGTLGQPRRPVGPDGVKVRCHPGLDLTPSADRSELTKWLRSELREHDVDVVHGHNLHHPDAAVAEMLIEAREQEGLHFRLVHTYHSLWGADRVKGHWDRHFAVSKFLADGLAPPVRGTADTIGPAVAYLGVAASRYRGIPELSERTEPSADGLVTILLPARLDPDKGGVEAVRAFAELVRSRVDGGLLRLVLTDPRYQVDYDGKCVGFRDTLEKHVAAEGVAGQVEFVEAGRSDMPGLYKRARIVLCPSVYGEPLGLVALEAMCAARPVVSTEVGGLGEAVGGHGETGCTVPQGDVTALAEAIGLLLDNPARAAEMGRRGRQRVLDEFDLDRTYLPRMARCYEELGAFPSVEHPPVGGQSDDADVAAVPDGDVDAGPAQPQPAYV